MIAYGILALLGMGVAMSAGGGSDDADVEPIQDDEDTGLTPDLLNPVTPETDLDAEYEQRIDDFIADLIAEPGLSAEDANARLEAFLAELEAERAGEPPVEEPPVEDTPTPVPPTVAPPIAEDPEEVQRPPLIDDERNPINRPENDLPPVEEEPEPVSGETPDQGPPPEAIPVEELVTVTTADGTELTDSSVLSEGPTSGENADRDYIVRTGSNPTDIEVGYDSQTTFLIDYSEQTDSVTAALNSDLVGDNGTETISINNLIDENGTEYTQTSTTQYFRGSTEITLEVTNAQLGAHVAQIDLTNPADTLTFDFAADVTGNLHLVYNDVELDDGSDTSTIRTLFVIATPTSVSSPSVVDIATALAQGGSTSGYALLAEIYLGQDSMTVEGNPAAQQPYEVFIKNFINDAPVVNSSVGWTSITEFDGEAPISVPPTAPADGEDEINPDVTPVVTPELFSF